MGTSPVFAAPYHLGGEDVYGRAGNPTWRALESVLGGLDGGECTVFPSGMAAITAVCQTLLTPGDVLVVPSDGYFLVRSFVSQLGFTVRELPTTGPWTADAVRDARLVLVETPSNPGLDVCDLRAVADVVHEAGALLAVDNTTATPLGQRPLELGADLTITSDTKAVAGHSDVVFGHVSAADPAITERLRAVRTGSGAIPGPFETWLVHRGVGTLDLRLTRQAENAAALVDVLRGHPAAANVRWPGLSGDPAHPVAARQMRRFNGVFRFELASAEAVKAFLAASELVAAATSFGGLHSTADRREQFGEAVPEGLIRFSAGCEDTADLVADVRGALDAVLRECPAL